MENTVNILLEKEVDIYIRIGILLLISMILFLVAFYTGRKPITTRKRKDHKGLISPILAEVLIDGKIDIKNLIMTTIVELQIKGNIEILGDDTIRLRHKENLEIHEHFLVNTIFGEEWVIRFKDINTKIYDQSNQNSSFVESISKISNEIQSKLYKMNLFSRKKMIILNLASYFSILLFINLPAIIIGNRFGYYVFTLIISILASIMYFLKFTGKPINIDEISTNIPKLNKELFVIALVCITLLLINSVIKEVKFDLFWIITIFFIYLLNIISFKLAKNNVLSNSGKKERQKILELKNYLEDYNLIQGTGENTYIEWNEFFAYSVAFGIPNPVTDKIYSDWPNLNITLYFINNLI